jgi:ArsR family transcriptional regulator
MNMNKPDTPVAPNDMLSKAHEAAALLKILSHPQRLCILCHMLDNERSVNELAELCSIPQPQVSQFLARMRLEKLITCRREGRNMLYRMTDPRLERIMGALFAILCNPKAKTCD